MWFSLIDIWNCIPFKHTFHVRVRLLDRGHWWATGYGCWSGTACRSWRPWGCPSWRLLKHRNQNKSVATNKSSSRFSIQRKKKKIKFHIWGTLRHLPLLLLLVWLAALLIKTKKEKKRKAWVRCNYCYITSITTGFPYPLFSGNIFWYNFFHSENIKDKCMQENCDK